MGNKTQYIGNQPTWCPGCGLFVVRNTLIAALDELEIALNEVVITYDIGCNGNGFDKIKTHAIKSLHGRSILPAIGVKYIYHNVPVISIIGDGGMYWEGVAHFIAAAQRNEDITVLVTNNQIYGLTTGQTSPTTEKKYKTKTYPYGTLSEPINPISLALSAGATFVARGWVGEPQKLKETIKAAINHKGFAIVDILQTCVTWNKINTLAYYKDKVIKVSHNITNKIEALAAANNREKVPLGIFYKEEKPTSQELHLQSMQKAISVEELIAQME